MNGQVLTLNRRPPQASLAHPMEGVPVAELIRQTDQARATQGLAASVALYAAWIEANPADPLMFAVLFNYSVVLTDLGDLERAKLALQAAQELNPDFISANINLGRLLERNGAIGDAIGQWARAADRLHQVTGNAIVQKCMALNQMGRVLEDAGQDEAAENVLRQSLEIDPTQREALQHVLALRQRQCKWPVIAPLDRLDAATQWKGLSPLSLAAHCDDPMLQLAAAHSYGLTDVGEPGPGFAPSFWAARESALAGRLRVGYLSSDLREHAVGYLTAHLFETHDRNAVEIFAYYSGPPIHANDPIHARIHGHVDQWLDISTMTDAQAAQRMADDGIHILVDLNGYTREGRTKLVALRPAPVIVNWLGFPGSMGSPHHHYIIADDWIIPSGDEIYYSEKVLRLPCYQPTDPKRQVAEQRPTRAQMGLPEQGMVYCCFNGLHKLTEDQFDQWLTILDRVPGSVLWLLSGPDGAQDRLKDHTARRGLAPERIIFAGKLANAHHLARYPLADLFLDTSPYGAHTTASDALWMGVPVLTHSGRSFASRVCGSLVRSAGLPDLVCQSAQDYQDRAVALGREPALLARYRDRLAQQRDRAVLFDTQGLAKALERLFRQMWDEWQGHALPRPDLTNLDLYHAVGAKAQATAPSPSPSPSWWRDKLAQRHAYRPIAPDSRLWAQDNQGA